MRPLPSACAKGSWQRRTISAGLKKEGGSDLRKRYQQKSCATIGPVARHARIELCLCIIQMIRKVAGLVAVALFRWAVSPLASYAGTGTSTARAAHRHIKVTVALADWPKETVGILIAAKVAPEQAERLFNDALRRVQ
jgi:hypothetical protein